MEPRLIGRGKRKKLEAAGLLANWLQWSRDLLVAERQQHGPLWGLEYSLQWSRDLLVAESKQRSSNGYRLCQASMEPRLIGRGKGLTL